MIGESLMKSISRFGAIYQMKQSLEGNLSNAVARNHAKTDKTVELSKNYNAQNDVPVQDSAKLFPYKHAYRLQKRSRDSHKTPRKGVNLVQG